MIYYILVLLLFVPCMFKNDINSQNNFTIQSDTLSLDEQLTVFKSLGYKLNEGITSKTILKDMSGNYLPGANIEQEFRNQQFSLLYFILGDYSIDKENYYTNQCRIYNLGFNDLGAEFINFIQRMGVITKGELKFTDIELKIENGFQWLNFKVNGISKSWKLMAVGHSDDSFFNRFVYLTTEFKTKGKYTFFENGGSDFIIDYATVAEQEQFIAKTKLKREWLGDGNHFSKYDPSK